MGEVVKNNLGITVRLYSVSFADVEAQTVAALQGEGFGVLTEIDVKDTLKKKLDADFRPYKILGVCNPPLAYRALSIAPQVGLLLPCDVTVSQGEGGMIEVSLVDPLAVLGVAAEPELQPVAEETLVRLERVAQVLSRW